MDLHLLCVSSVSKCVHLSILAMHFSKNVQGPVHYFLCAHDIMWAAPLVVHPKEVGARLSSRCSLWVFCVESRSCYEGMTASLYCCQQHAFCLLTVLRTHTHTHCRGNPSERSPIPEGPPRGVRPGRDLGNSVRLAADAALFATGVPNASLPGVDGRSLCYRISTQVHDH